MEYHKYESEEVDMSLREPSIFNNSNEFNIEVAEKPECFDSISKVYDFSINSSNTEISGSILEEFCIETSNIIAAVAKPVTEENEKVRQWREQQAKLIEAKVCKEQNDIEILRQRGKEELKQMYIEINKSRLQKHCNLNEQSKNIYCENKESFRWESVGSLCDMAKRRNRTAKDVTRMREIYKRLAQEEKSAKLQNLEKLSENSTAI